jgi:hypothetical protein
VEAISFRISFFYSNPLQNLHQYKPCLSHRTTYRCFPHPPLLLPLCPPPMASSAAAAPPSRHSVFDASYIRSEFAAAGISAHFIPLIWKYGSMSPPLESSSHDALTPSCFLCHYSCLILRNFLIQYRSECWFSACTGTCFITLGAGTWTASHRCRRPRMRSSGRSSGRPHRP